MKLSGKTFYILGGVIFLLSVAYVFLGIFPVMQKNAYRAQFSEEKIESFTATERIQFERNSADIENSTRLTLAQIIGGLALLSRLYFTYQNVKAAQYNAKSAQENIKVAQENLRITEEGKLTDRFSKAVELLGSTELELRLGGIYALERIAHDSQKDHWTVMEVLTAFVRENSQKRHTKPEKNLSATEQTKEKKRKEHPEDILAILTTISRRKWRETEIQPINLSHANLSNMNLLELNFEKLNLLGTNFSNSFFSKTNFSAAKMFMANLSEANMLNVNLSDADLTSANLSGAFLMEVDLNNTSLLSANLDNAELEFVGNLTARQISLAKNYKSAQLPKNLINELKKIHTEPTKAMGTGEDSSEENETTK